jgi:hypothetical protein
VNHRVISLEKLNAEPREGFRLVVRGNCEMGGGERIRGVGVDPLMSYIAA